MSGKTTLYFCLALFFCCSSEISTSQLESAWRASLDSLRGGEDGRGALRIHLGDVKVDDDMLLKVSDSTSTGLRLLDLVDVQVEENRLRAFCRMPIFVVNSNIEVVAVKSEAVLAAGESVLRFMDVGVVLSVDVGKDGTISAGVVDADIQSDVVAAAFDFGIPDWTTLEFQARLQERRKLIIDAAREAAESAVAGLVSASLKGRSNAPAPLATTVGGEDPVVKANRFVDQLLKDQRQFLKDNLEVIKLPDTYFEFSKTIVFVETHGFVRLTKGHLDNLHALARKGDCSVVVQDNVLKLEVDLGVDNLLGAYFIEAEFGVFHTKSDLKVKVSSIQIVISGIQSFREIENDQGPVTDNILNFDVGINAKVNIGDVDIDVNITGALDWLFNLIAEKVVSILKGRVQDMVKDPLKDLIKTINGS